MTMEISLLQRLIINIYCVVLSLVSFFKIYIEQDVHIEREASVSMS